MSKTDSPKNKPHVEQHFTGAENVRDVVIGMSDGLTVPFALAAGLAGAIDDTSIVVVAGLAEIAAGSIAMGLGGYLAGKTDVESYDNEWKREAWEAEHLSDAEEQEVRSFFRDYGLTDQEMEPVVKGLQKDRKKWVDFHMKFELDMTRPDPRRAFISALTIAGAYIVGGLIPLSPYMVMPHIGEALTTSVLLTLVALFVFGFVKSRFTGMPAWRGAIQTMLIGGLAAAAAFGIASLFD